MRIRRFGEDQKDDRGNEEKERKGKERRRGWWNEYKAKEEGEKKIEGIKKDRGKGREI